MEIKPEKALTLAMLFSAAALGLILAIFHWGEKSTQGSTYQTALRFKEETSSNNLASAIRFRNEEEKVVLLNKKSKDTKVGSEEDQRQPASAISQDYYMDSLDSGQAEFASRLDELAEQRMVIKNELHSKGEEIPLYLEFEPSLSLALGTFLNVKPSSLNKEDLQKANLSAEDWYHIKSFAGSEDFKVLLKQGRLTRESLKPKKLRLLYGAAHQVARD